MSEKIKERLIRVRDNVRAAEERYKRVPGSVQLLAVSKKRSLEKIRSAIRCGQKHFAESQAQEAVPKIKALKDKDIIWHFIGPIQSNKAKLIAQYFSWVHSIDRYKIAQFLNDYRIDNLPPLDICIQINISGEASKSGITLKELPAFAHGIVKFPNLRLRGLMAVPAFTQNFSMQRRAFRKIYRIFRKLNKQGFSFDTLSLGMSSDFEAAIAEGSTMVRIGTAIFGERVC